MGRVVGLDFGTVRIGVATSDELRMIARALTVVTHDKHTFVHLQALFDELGSVDQIVVGLPLTLKGKDSPMTTQARAFAEDVQAHLSLPVELWDERLSSAQVEKHLQTLGVKRKDRAQKSDALSAMVILQSYLDRYYALC